MFDKLMNALDPNADKKKLDSIKNPENPTLSVTMLFDETTLVAARTWIDDEQFPYTTFPVKPGDLSKGTVFVFEDRDDALLFKMQWEDRSRSFKTGGNTEGKW